MFRLEMLEAQYGDALWLEYGDAARPNVVIIDCGFKENYRELKERISGLDPGQLRLLVLTHIDDDHIRGGVPLLADPQVTFPQKMDVWFNGWHHLTSEPADQLSAVQGEMFAALIANRGLSWNSLPPWNGHTIVTPDEGPLPSGTLEGGLTWTLLSPSWEKLSRLKDLWKKQIESSGFKPGDEESFLELLNDRPESQPEDQLGSDTGSIEGLSETEFAEDNKEPNGSSIALLMEFEGKSLLLAGDAHPGILEASLRRLAHQRGVRQIALSAFKVSHHGSKKNTSPGLLSAIDCKVFLFSSNGKKHGHPSPECIARIVKAFPGATLRFNYESDFNVRWTNIPDQLTYSFTSMYPKDGARTLAL